MYSPTNIVIIQIMNAKDYLVRVEFVYLMSTCKTTEMVEARVKI